jgi:hypothetical protein
VGLKALKTLLNGVQAVQDEFETFELAAQRVPVQGVHVVENLPGCRLDQGGFVAHGLAP